GVVAVALLGRHASRGGVRVRQQPERLELRQLRAHRRRRDGDAGALDERLRADRLAAGDVLLDNVAEDLLLTWRELDGERHLQDILPRFPAGTPEPGVPR